jgi:hypothetical protein
MDAGNVERKPITMSAAEFLRRINEGGAEHKPLARPIQRQAWYKTMLPIFLARGLVVTNGRKQSLIVCYEGDDCYGAKSLLGQWQHYARFRERMVANGEWIGRRNWSWEDMLACQDQPVPTLRAVETTD